MLTTAFRLHPIALELLRHGPSHNQLLSKITDYVALCGNLGAETLRLPFNHLEHEMRLEALSYTGDRGRARTQLAEMADLMGELLGAVPGLPPALSLAKDSRCDMALLRMVLTPHELALLPFECAAVPKGAPGGAGSRLLLQTTAPVTLTREVRGLSPPEVRWPGQPRILFAWAAPDGVGGVPHEEHLLALRTALEPWLEPYRGDGGDDAHVEHMARQVERCVTVLPRATVDDIFEACSRTAYTHVHILAHGAPKVVARGQQQIGVALHAVRSSANADVVDGARLANALRAGGGNEAELPVMVVLATCDSGQVRSVVTHGGSIAHDLHVAGVPLVVASQFPLSKVGSVVMADELYRRVFEAQDPRVAMHFVRRSLYSTFEDFHDWASLVVYASMPRDFDAQLAALQHAVAKRRINRLLDDADAMIDRSTTASSSRRNRRGTQLPPLEAYERLMSIINQLEGPAKELLELTEDKVEGTGLQASTKKRTAEVLFYASRQTMVVDSTQRRLRTRCLAAMAGARVLYAEALARNLSTHWVGVQCLCLTLVLHRAGKLRASYDERHWTAVRVAAELRLQHPDVSERAWAHSSLAELLLLEVARLNAPPTPERRQEIFDHVHIILEAGSIDPFVVYSTRRQFGRYVDWFSVAQDADGKRPGLNTYGIAEELVMMLEV